MLSESRFTKNVISDVISPMLNQKPVLKEYLDIHQYLEDVYKFRKQTEEAFSYETWSQELGLNHRSYLRQIVIGRRSLSAAIVSLLVQRLNLQGTDKEYFEVLALYSKSRSADKKNIYGKRMAQLIRTDVEQTPLPEDTGFVLDPILPRLHTFLSFIDAPRKQELLVKALRTTPEKVSWALGVLEQLQLVENRPDGATTKSSSFLVPDKLGSQTLINYHRASLHDAIAAGNLEISERRYKSLLISLSPAEFEEFLVDLQQFTKQVLSRFDSSQISGRRLFQVNLNLHSVSEEVEGSTLG